MLQVCACLSLYTCVLFLELVLPSFVSCITRITHFDKKTWQNNLVLYKIQIHVRKDPYTSTKFKSMCNMTPLPLQNSNPCAKWPFYKIQIQVYPHRVEPLQNSNPCQNKTLQNQGSNQKNTPQNSGPKFIQKLLP